MNPDDRTATAEECAFFFAQFLSFVLEGVQLDPDGKGMTTVVRRWIAIGYHLFPDMFTTPVDPQRPNRNWRTPGPLITMTELSRQPLVGCDPKTLKKMAQQFVARMEQLS